MKGAAEKDGEFGVMKANGSDRWEERWHSSGERLAHSPGHQRDVWRQNGNEKVNNRIQRGIIKWACSCYANTRVHRWILTQPLLRFSHLKRNNMKQFSINHKHDEHETRQKWKQEGRRLELTSSVRKDWPDCLFLIRHQHTALSMRT